MSVGSGITVEEAIRRGYRKDARKYQANKFPPNTSTRLPLKRIRGTLRKGRKHPKKGL